MNRLDEIQARVDAATPGPWIELPLDDPTCSSYSAICSGEEQVIATDWNYGDGFPCPRQPDCDFIAHAREDIPYLLARVRELEAERAVWQQIGQVVMDDHPCRGGHLCQEHAGVLEGGECVNTAIRGLLSPQRTNTAPT